MAKITQVRWGGFGGQGVVLVGVLLGQAGVLDGKYATVANSYGPQARGSACKSEVIFADGPIDFPNLITADILIAMSESSYNSFCRDVRPGSGTILYDPDLVVPQEGLPVRQVGIPATDHALRKLQEKQVANIVLLGALVEITGIVSHPAVRKAIHHQVGERFRSLNLKAFSLGVKLGRAADG